MCNAATETTITSLQPTWRNYATSCAGLIIILITTIAYLSKYTDSQCNMHRNCIELNVMCVLSLPAVMCGNIWRLATFRVCVTCSLHSWSSLMMVRRRAPPIHTSNCQKFRNSTVPVSVGMNLRHFEAMC